MAGCRRGAAAPSYRLTLHNREQHLALRGRAGAFRRDPAEVSVRDEAKDRLVLVVGQLVRSNYASPAAE